MVVMAQPVVAQVSVECSVLASRFTPRHRRSAAPPRRCAIRRLPSRPPRIRDPEMSRRVEARAIPPDVVGPPAEEQSGVAALDVAFVVAGVAAGGGESIAGQRASVPGGAAAFEAGLATVEAAAAASLQRGKLRHD